MTRQKATRPYRMKHRAAAQDQTRLRITESAVELHRTLGPSKTSISAVAVHAGVRRSTIYRHFPDEAALFDACSAHWASANPLPDLAAWAAVEAPDARLRIALEELYAYYRHTESMLDNLFRDETISPLVKERFAAMHAYLTAAQQALMQGRQLRGTARRRTNAAIGHAISFSTWKSLVREQQLTDTDSVKLMRALVAAAGARPRS